MENEQDPGLHHVPSLLCLLGNQCDVRRSNHILSCICLTQSQIRTMGIDQKPMPGSSCPSCLTSQRMNLWTEEPGPSEVTAIVTEASLCKLLQLLVDYELLLGRESPTTQACSFHRINRTTLPPKGFPNETWVKAGMTPWLTIPWSLLKSLWHKDVGVGGLFSWLQPQTHAAICYSSWGKCEVTSGLQSF